MNRWTYALPRVILAIILVTILSLGMDPAMHWALTQAVESTTGGRFHVAHVNADISNGIAAVQHLEVSDADDPKQRMLEVERGVFTFDPWSLTKRRLVITDGELHGVRINANTRGADCCREAARPELVNEAAALGKAWQQVVSAPAPLLQQMEGIQQAQQSRKQRVAQYQALVREAADWQLRFDELDELTKYVGDNPLRMTPGYRARLEQLAMVGDQIDQLNEQLAAVQRQVEEDRLALSEKQQADMALLRDNTELAPVAADKLSAYLLEDEWAGRIGAWVEWIRQSRRLIHIQPKRSPFAWSNARGVDVLLNAGRTSDFDIQNLYVQGTGQVADQVFNFHGTLNHLTDEPSVASHPAVLTLVADGPGAVQMDAVLDRSNNRSLDRVRVVCPALPTKRQVWGNPQEFAIESHPATLRIALELTIEDNQLQGHVDFAQHEASLTASWPGSRREGQANRTVQAALEELSVVNGSLDISGTLDHPVWTLESDLGEEIANRMQDVLYDELEERAEMLVQQYQRQVNAEMDQLVKVLGDHQRSAAELLAAKTQELQKFRARIYQRTDLMDRLVRNAGPLENLLR